jgi:hypothetical protein
VLHRAGLTREAAADDRADHVILIAALGDVERLVDHQAQGRAGEIGLLVAAIDRDLARTRLQPHAGNGVLAAAGRISAAISVELLLAQRRFGTGADGRRRGDFLIPSRSGRRRGRSGLSRQVGEVGKGLAIIVGH